MLHYILQEMCCDKERLSMTRTEKGWKCEEDSGMY